MNTNSAFTKAIKRTQLTNAAVDVGTMCNKFAITFHLLLSVQFGLSLYKMILEFDRYEIEYSIIGDFSKIRIRKYNRTTPVINGSYDLAVDLDDNYEVCSLEQGISSKSQSNLSLFRRLVSRAREVS